MVFPKCTSDSTVEVPATAGAMSSQLSSDNQPPPSKYYNTKQAAAYLGLSTQYMEIARHKGSGPQYIKLAKAVRYRVHDLDEWMGRHLQRHTAENIVVVGGNYE
jgi:predicted DNA-binding transcriptional regulator AlpA